MGKHKADYPNIKNYNEYIDYSKNIKNNPEKIIYDKVENEYYYLKGKDLLRVKPNGDFVSLYPGSSSDRVIRAIKDGGIIWEQR